MIQEFNENTLKYLNSFTENEIITNIVLILSDSPIFFLPIFLLSTWIYYTIKSNKEEKTKILRIFYAPLLAIFINYFVKFFIEVERPETILEATWKLILEHVPDNSFPSDHSSVWIAFTFALLFFWYKKVFFAFLPFAVAMILSRVIAWVHWPLDVIAWFVVWLVSAFVIYKTSDKLDFLDKIANKVDIFYIINNKIQKKWKQ